MASSGVSTFVRAPGVRAARHLTPLLLSSQLQLSHPPLHRLLDAKLRFLQRYAPRACSRRPPACSPPPPGFNGITLGVAGLLLYIIFMFGLCMAIMRLRNFSADVVLGYKRFTLSNIVFVCVMAYAPVTEVVLSVFSCRKIGEFWYLREEASKQCYTSSQESYRAAATFWTIVFVAGVPVLYVALLWYYNVPAVARELKHNSRLRALIDFAHIKRIPLPDVPYHTITTKTISEGFVSLMFAEIIVKKMKKVDIEQAAAGNKPALVAAPESEEGVARADALAVLSADAVEADPSAMPAEAVKTAAEPSPQCSALAEKYPKAHAVGCKAAALGLQATLWVARQAAKLLGLRNLSPVNVELLSHEEKLKLLLAYASEHLRPHIVTWHSMEDDPRLEGAKEAIGSLYEEFYADCWFWIIVEVFNKLMITGVLGFIAPGTEAQTVAGMGLTFLMMLGYQKALPYKEKTYRHIGYAASVTLFVFLVFALMLKANVTVGQDNNGFYGGCIGILMCSVFVVPAVLVIKRLRWSLDEDPEEDEEEEGEGSFHDAHHPAHDESHGEKEKEQAPEHAATEVVA